MDTHGSILDDVNIVSDNSTIRNYTRVIDNNDGTKDNESTVLVVSLEAVTSSTLCFEEDQPCTGHAVWFAADNLSNFLQDHYRNFTSLRQNLVAPQQQPFRILELGAGPGLSGIWLAKLLEGKDKKGDLASILMTDGDEEVVKLLRRNCTRNCLTESKRGDNNIHHDVSNISVDCQRFLWGKLHAEKLLQSQNGFDIILGADLVYGRRNLPGNDGTIVADLFDTVEMLLRNNNSLFYLGFTRRDLPIEIVLEAANVRGLVWELQADYNYDIFDTNTDEQTCFWRDAIYSFTRGDGLAQLKIQQGIAISEKA